MTTVNRDNHQPRQPAEDMVDVTEPQTAREAPAEINFAGAHPPPFGA
jgi:hypothetical protein